MKRRTLFLCITLLLIPHVATLAQKKKTFCPTPAPSPFKHSAQIVTTFSPSARGVITTLEHPRPLTDARGNLYLKASFVHKDPRQPGSQMIELYLVSESKAQRFGESRDLTLMCDGKPFPLTSRINYQTLNEGRGLVFESLRVSLSHEDLRGVAEARRVAARIGASEFELTENHLESLRELVSLTKGSVPRWRAE